ncbi:MAG: zinc-binding dehydrogenase [Clostridiales bacterium]|nr:zinc-binding dehydrogenase [Clostridiales bacterium]
MKTRAVRLYGENDLRLDEFELPAIKDDEILAKVVSDSICMSSYKAAIQGAKHKRVPGDIAENPVMIGHEFAGEILEVGKKWQNDFKPGSKFTIQPAHNYKGTLHAPGYSYPHIGGNATYVIIPNEIMETGCLLEYKGEGYFYGSLTEPISTIIHAFHANYHTEPGRNVHHMGVKEGGNMAILGGVGPMGLGAISYAIGCGRRPGLLVVTDIDDAKLKRASEVITVEEAAEKGVDLRYINTSKLDDSTAHLMSLTDGKGYDDVFVFVPVKAVAEQAGDLLGRDGCLNFFAGPTDPNFKANFNFYNVHYASTHVVGTTGGNNDDMKESLELMASGCIDPAMMITHIGGLNSVAETTLNLPNIPGGKKLIYTHIEMELTALDDLEEKGKTDPRFARLAEIVKGNNGIWNVEAENYLLDNFCEK